MTFEKTISKQRAIYRNSSRAGEIPITTPETLIVKRENLIRTVVCGNRVLSEGDGLAVTAVDICEYNDTAYLSQNRSFLCCNS